MAEPFVGRSARSRRIGAQQALVLEFAPRRSGNLGPEHLRVALDFRRLLTARNHADDRGMTEREAERRLGEFHAVLLADGLDASYAIENILRRERVIVTRAGLGAGREYP